MRSTTLPDTLFMAGWFWAVTAPDGLAKADATTRAGLRLHDRIDRAKNRKRERIGQKS
jgi:hypothetical protein